MTWRLCRPKRDPLMAREIVEAMKRSGKSDDERMTFLKAS